MKTALLIATLLAGSVGAQPQIRVVSDRLLQGGAATALDVRWASDDSIYVSSYVAGVHRVNTASGKVAPAAFVESGRNCRSCSRLGVSDRYVVTAFPAFQMAWKEWNRPRIHNYLFDAVVDLDLHGDRLLMLGSRSEGGRWAPDGAIAWTGSLDEQLKDLRPILFSRQGPKAMTISRCGFLEPGAVRFASDGSFVIVPGVEPDVYLYDRTGKLVHTWQTTSLGFVDRCDLTEPQVDELSRDPEQRARWRAARVMVDDVLITAAGPALLLHEFRAGAARWTMVVLQRNGPPRRIVLPFSIQSDVASLRADVRGNRIAFLIRTSGQWRPKATPAPARLIIAELR